MLVDTGDEAKKSFCQYFQLFCQFLQYIIYLKRNFKTNDWAVERRSLLGYIPV